MLVDVAAGDDSAVEKLLTAYRDYVRMIINVRMDPALQARVDPSDVVQETLITASRKIADFARRRPTTFRLWLRSQAIDRMIDARRRHVSLKRDARRDISVNDASSLAILGGLGGCPQQRLLRHELVLKVRTALEELSEPDREILLLRHAEQLTNGEAATVLNINPDAASKRYGRAALKLVKELRRLGLSRG
jgi:RNA polymerase sigma-70 factor (ECF subfamily)